MLAWRRQRAVLQASVVPLSAGRRSSPQPGSWSDAASWVHWLTAGFPLQITPPIWAAQRTDRPTGISRGTWLLILGELACWAAFGVHKSDPRLMVLGFTGIVAGILMLARIRYAIRAR